MKTETNSKSITMPYSEYESMVEEIKELNEGKIKVVAIGLSSMTYIYYIDKDKANEDLKNYCEQLNKDIKIIKKQLLDKSQNTTEKINHKAAKNWFGW